MVVNQQPEQGSKKALHQKLIQAHQTLFLKTQRVSLCLICSIVPYICKLWVAFVYININIKTVYLGVPTPRLIQ